MKLYCVRHGQANSPSSTEPDPALSVQGELEIARIAGALFRRGVSPSYIFSSYKKRARQTASIIAKKLELRCEPEVMDFLDPAKSLEPLMNEIEHWSDETLLVGHLPFIGELVSQLMTDQPTHQLVKFTPGTIVCLVRGEGNQWLMDWVLRPDLWID